MARTAIAGGFTMGEWRVFPELHRVQSLGADTAEADGGGRHIDPQAMTVLLVLASAAPHVVSADELLDRAWPGKVVTDNAVHRVIAQLRRALDDSRSAPRYIETIPKRGYRLLQDVQPHAGGAIDELGHAHTLTLSVPALGVLGEGPRVQWLATGLTQDLQAALVDLPGLTVATVAEDSDDLCLSGSVRTEGQRTRVAVQLVDPHRNLQLWATSVDHEGDDVMALQDQVAGQVRAAVSRHLDGLGPAAQLQRLPGILHGGD